MKISLLLPFLLFTLSVFGQEINPKNIEIVRDEWGVPHIFGKTDAEVAYGIAWAHAEDDFENIQIPLMGARRVFAAVEGKTGALLDAIAFLIKLDEVVDEKYEEALSPEFKAVLSGYAQGLNRYAELHPKEIRHKKLFPINEKDIIKGYVLITTFISNVHYDLQRIFGNNLGPIDPRNISGGSNGFAFSPKKTKDGKTYLVSNSHQPLKGNTAWYELSVHSEEGWDFTGANFAGGVTPLVGTNKNLGWTHTVNFDDFHDTYKLKMHPTEELKYRLDGQWLELEERVVKLKVKIFLGIKIPVKRTFYWSAYGPTVKNESGFYAMRFPSNMVVGQAGQWYDMNKASNFEEFEAALNKQQMANLTMVYADKAGNIAFLNNGLFPDRDPNYDWNTLLPGDTTATLWAAKFKPLEELQYVKNPDCGYVFNSNNTGNICTCAAENPKADRYPEKLGWKQEHTTRSVRVLELMAEYDKMSYEDIKTVKYDAQISFPIHDFTKRNFDDIRQLDPKKYPDLAETIKRIARWDGGTKVDNPQAAIISLIYQEILAYTKENNLSDQKNTLPESVIVDAVRYAQGHLLQHFGTLDIALGDLQKHVRGDKVLPIGGLPGSITAMYTKPYKDGRLEGRLGESFILFATYGKDGVEKIETVNCYGASNHEDSPHHTDQMELYAKQGLKEVFLDRERIFEEGKRVYSPE